jgi:dihydropteroate synthase
MTKKRPKIEKADKAGEDFILKEEDTYTLFSEIEETGKGFWILRDKDGNERTRVISLESYDKEENSKFRSIQFNGSL